MNSIFEAMRQISHYRTLIAVGLPLLGGAMVIATSTLTPRGKAKGILTGAYLLLACIGASCLLFSLIAAVAHQPSEVFLPLLLPGIVLTVIMGIFSPAIIREYQLFEFRKLAANLFRHS
ncbi:hypothetical protein ACFPT7_18960 [Acidicapsa dinghuensis]|uniref:Uncharacterized protein n=1 Tax=Acidicapsa dinghuensis TaxID=2218256 RepID=A0ABW1EJB3_9BACT|nr:hypothetical protein [Acidicapsa dinghuensis]